MKYAILILAITSLACGTLSQMPTEIPPQATQNAPTPFVTPTDDIRHVTETPYTVEVLGEDTTWNIREGSSLGHPVIGIAHGGDRFIILSMYGGWVETDAGWICGQAFGASDRCE